MRFEDRCESRKQQSPQFQYWHLVLSMELAILIFIRSLREANFSLYCQALCQLIPYMFVNNNDLLSLDTKNIAHPSAAERVATHLSTGKTCFETFMEALKSEDTSSFHAPIKKTKMDFFQQEEKVPANTKEKVMKEDCQLFSKLFISSEQGM